MSSRLWTPGGMVLVALIGFSVLTGWYASPLASETAEDSASPVENLSTGIAVPSPPQAAAPVLPVESAEAPDAIPTLERGGVAPPAIRASQTPPAAAPPAIQLRPTTPPAAPRSVPTSPNPTIRNAQPTPRPAAEDLSSPATEPQVLEVLRLRATSAVEMFNILQQITNEDERDVRMTVDGNSNSLILRGTPSALNRVRSYVEQIEKGIGDSPADPNSTAQDLTLKLLQMANRRTTGSTHSTEGSPGASSRRVSEFAAPMQRQHSRQSVTAAPAANPLSLQVYLNLERQTEALATAYRHDAISLGEDHPQQKTRREEIAHLLGRAFDLRQSMQMQELKELEERVERIQQTLQKREQNRSEIISNRVQDLLKGEEFRWDTSVTPPPSTVPF